MQQLKLGQHNY